MSDCISYGFMRDSIRKDCSDKCSIYRRCCKATDERVKLKAEIEADQDNENRRNANTLYAKGFPLGQVYDDKYASKKAS